MSAKPSAIDFLLAQKKVTDKPEPPDWLPVVNVYMETRGAHGFRASVHPAFFDIPEAGLEAIGKIKAILDMVEADIRKRVGGAK